ncbi:MAG: hypothetical protein P8177_00360 [Gemmatimonadota bacterium]|jgi:hypothetical protein
MMERRARPGVDLFWQEADRSESGQDPLERELEVRIDALARYRRLIAEAESGGRDEAAGILMRQHDREEASVTRLREAIRARRG